MKYVLFSFDIAIELVFSTCGDGFASSNLIPNLFLKVFCIFEGGPKFIVFVLPSYS